MISQLLTATIHNPRVQDMNRVVGHPDLLAIELGNGEYHGQVTLLVSDADWNSIGMAVSAFLDGEDADDLIDDGADERDTEWKFE